MQTKRLIAAVAFGSVIFGGAVHAQGPEQKPVDPQAVSVDEYVPNQYLDPNLLAIQVRRAEDRILALEQTNERLIKGYNDLAAKYNALREYLDAGAGPQQ